MTLTLDDIYVALEHREKLLKTITSAAEVLLTTKEEDTLDAIMTGMEIVGKNLNVDRVQIWRNEMVDDRLCFVMRYEWLSEVGKTKREVPIGLTVAYEDVPGWYDMFRQGGYINGTVASLSRLEADFLGYYDIISIVNYPLFLNNEFIGFFSVNDCRFSREFSDTEMSIVASAGLMLTSVFNRREQNKLKQSYQIAEESNRAKSRFLARMSHEIRTPITAILGISEIQLYQDLPPIIAESFEKIHNSATLLLHIINDILDLSKIEAQKVELVNNEYTLASVINDVSNMHFAFSGEKSPSFKLTIDEKMPSVLMGDSLRIKQILSNLLSNAFKYTEGNGTVEMSWTCKEDKADSVFLVITIKDTGMGMTKTQLETLFSSNEYTRFHEHENREIVGTGLGMPIVLSLAQMMGATIDIQSEVGEGTSVEIRFPQTVIDKKRLGKDVVSRLHQFTSYASIKKERVIPEAMPYGRVLVVDDMDANIYVIQGLLNFYSLNIETCNSGQDAIDKIEQGNVYDLIFMDQMMPNLSGTETLRTLRNMGYHEPIIVLTADAVSGKEEEYIQSGFDGFITKPIDTRALDAALIKFIKDKQPSDSLNAEKVEYSDMNIDDYQSNEELLTKLRLIFIKSHKKTMTEIKKAIADKHTEAARFLVHSLKGSAGTIKESTIVNLAEKMEARLKDNQLPTPEELTTLETELTAVLEKLKSQEPQAQPQQNTLTNSEILKLLEELKPLLDLCSPQSLEIAEKLRQVPQAAVLVKLLEDFEFARAEGILDVVVDMFDV